MVHEIRMMTSPSDISLGSQFFRDVWGGSEDVVPSDIAIASGHSGGYFSAAFDDAGRLVGASYGFVGAYSGQKSLHSHVTAASVPGVGFALKQHQFEWAKQNGFAAITWTYDPLIRRNSVFNFEKLGALAVEYLVNFYGEMHDELNRGEESDRLFLVWNINQTTPYRQAESEREPAFAIGVSGEGRPQVSENLHEYIENRVPMAIYLPKDIEKLRVDLPEIASEWRSAVRDALNTCFSQGAFIRRMHDERAALLVEWQK